MLYVLFAFFPFFSHSLNIFGSNSKDQTQLFFIFSLLPNDSIVSLWQQFTSKYKDSKDILLTTINCSEDIKFCNRYHIKDFPSILTISNSFYQIHHTTLNSVECFETILINSKPNITSFCQNHVFNKESKYPVFVLQSDDDTACLDISKYQLLYPKASFKFRKVPVNQITQKIELYLSPNQTVFDTSITKKETFITEYLHDHFGNWTFSDAKKLIRRLVLIIYDDNSPHIPQKADFETYINRFYTKLLFNKMPYSHFAKIVGTTIKFPNFPSMVVTNQRKTLFTFLDYASMTNESLARFLYAVTKGYKELHIKYYLDPIKNSIKRFNPKRMLVFFLASLSVLAFTVFLLIIKAYRCVHSNRKIPRALRKRSML